MTRSRSDAFIVDVHVKGRVAEKLANIFFLKQKCHVFNNISSHGPIDLVVVDKEGKTMLIDVKSVSKRKRDNSPIHRTPTPSQSRLGIKILYVDVEEGTCHWWKERDKVFKII
tara:strand:+ start:160 stop:498 length:339 start_codon:yes stop_codon:yes gene_type:complete